MIPITIFYMLNMIFASNYMLVSLFFVELDRFVFFSNIYWACLIAIMISFPLNAGATSVGEAKKVLRKVHQILRSVRDRELSRVVLD